MKKKQRKNLIIALIIGALFIINLFVADPLPIIDEVVMGALAAYFGVKAS